jgi:hypothetical protein
MTSLIAVLSSGKGTWGHVNSLMKLGEWDRVYLVCSEFAYDNFDVDKNKVVKLKIDEKNTQKSVRVLANFFKKEIKDFEVGLNLVSGTGVEHMIVLAAVLRAGLGVRLLLPKNNEIEELKLLDEDYSMIDKFE